MSIGGEGGEADALRSSGRYCSSARGCDGKGMRSGGSWMMRVERDMMNIICWPVKDL